MEEYKFSLFRKVSTLVEALVILICYILFTLYVSKYLGVLVIVLWILFLWLAYLALVAILYATTAKFIVKPHELTIIASPGVVHNIRWDEIKNKEIKKRNSRIKTIILNISSQKEPVILSDDIENFDSLSKEILKYSET